MSRQVIPCLGGSDRVLQFALDLGALERSQAQQRQRRNALLVPRARLVILERAGQLLGMSDDLFRLPWHACHLTTRAATAWMTSRSPSADSTRPTSRSCASRLGPDDHRDALVQGDRTDVIAQGAEMSASEGPRLWALLSRMIGSPRSTHRHVALPDDHLAASPASSSAADRAEGRDLTDVDGIKHALGRWDEDPAASGLHARRLTLALAGAHLSAGYDVVLGQYLARTSFIEDLETLAERLDAQWVELILDIDSATLADRLARRANEPDRPEHLVNNRLVGPEDAQHLPESIETVRRSRPGAVRIDARGSHTSTLDRLRAALER